MNKSGNEYSRDKKHCEEIKIQICSAKEKGIILVDYG
jgi:hypothetical protein